MPYRVVADQKNVEETATTPVEPPDARPRHLPQFDVVRVIAFFCVITVHCIGSTTHVHSVKANTAWMLLHFSREVFFFVSAFVLFYTRYDRPPRYRGFLARRLLIIGVPYVTWSVLYWAGHRWRSITQPDRLPHELGILGHELLYGTAMYHLYFLMVLLQLAVIFPLFRWLVRATRGHHGLLLAAAAVVQVVIAFAVWRHLQLPGVLGWYLRHSVVFFPTYSFLLVSGAVSAVHFEAVHGWVTRHGRLVALALLLGAALDLTEFWAGMRTGLSPLHAAYAIQPVILVWATVVIGALYWFGCRWTTSRLGDASARAVSTAAMLSFGVYLAHPSVRRILDDVGFSASLGKGYLPALEYAVIVTAGAALITAVAMRTPLSLCLTGRRRPTNS